MTPHPLQAIRRLVASLLMLFMTSLPAAFAAEAAHPRLLFSAGEIPALREKIKREPFAAMFQAMKADGEKPFAAAAESYDQAEQLVRASSLYALTGDERWAAEARKWTEARIGDANEWANPKRKGLNLYMHGKSVALGYDLCYGSKSWDAAFSATVSKALKTHGDVIFKSGGMEQNRSPASNWQGVRYASAALCYLASDEPMDDVTLKACHGRVATYIKENIGSGKGSRGWNIEGMGYTMFPWGTVGPAGIALARHNPELDIRKASPGVPYALWTIYASCVWMGNVLAHPDFGDDNPRVSGEGCFGLAFYYATDALKPGLKYWYDRTFGSKGLKDYDSSRGSRLYSILYYPSEVVEKQPMEIPEWREAFVDTGGNGYFTYRNTYTPHESIVSQIYAKLRGDKGHNGPDALSFRILGLDTAWAVGGGRYGLKTGGQNVYFRSMNTLYPVDPDEKLAINGNSGNIVGTPISKPDGSGSVVLSIPENNVGTKEHKRWFLTDFSKKAGVDAVCIIADQSANGKFWQMVTVKGNAVATSGNTFTIQGADGATLRGTVVYPTGDLGWKTGERLRGSNFLDGIDSNNFVHFQTPDGKALVVLSIARRGQQHPAVSGDAQDLHVGGATYKVSDDRIE